MWHTGYMPSVQRHVTPELLASDAERFWSGVHRSAVRGECWPWVRGVTGGGYGIFHTSMKTSPTGKPIAVGAHRVAWMLGNAKPIPAGQVIDHMCENRLCCNPRHLRAVSNLVNIVASGSHGVGFKTRKPKRMVGRTGRVTWRVRFRRLEESGRWINGCKTFATEAEAEEFIRANPWRPFLEHEVA